MRRKFKRKHGLVKMLVSWGLFAVYIIIFPPESLYILLGFYIILFLALFFTLNLLLASWESFLLTGFILSLLLLRQTSLDNIVNIILLSGLAITLYLYFRN